ncbi:MAG TPA: asparagine synthase (glutamine-hydrolyzing) [Pyrinomonadaceae bacterium]|nr:asparagine synthase (glutamine-hydrolyzing) [Pyrinomonadaceae bacterium]
MCGINGIAFSSRSELLVSPPVLKRMRDVITHRGPDDEGIFVDGRVGLGHRRLSIVDVASGHQPMTNEDGSLYITYNGEIYNHADYREPLIARGHVYKTHCDTETILHLYAEYGDDCVDHLRGMFAFAIWDRNRRELFIARDRLGVKPLYYVHAQDGSLYFASEIKALLEARAVKPDLNFRAFSDYLANHATSGEETLFAGVKRLLPGHTLRWRDGEVKIRKYWDVSFEKQAPAGRSDQDYIAEWSELFRKSVQLRLMADVPLGMFLSGGIDSSAIAAVMSTLVDEPIKTFSVAFAEREANELEYARLVARTFKTDHHEIVISPEQFWARLPDLIWHEDEPLAHPSSVALYFVSQLASQHVKVVLTGEGSDELMAGYARYRKTILNLALGEHYHRMVPSGVRDLVRKQFASMTGSKLRLKLGRTFLNLAPDIESIYFDNFAVFSRSLQQQLLTPSVVDKMGAIDPYAGVRDVLTHTDAQSLLDRLLYADIKTYLHELLMKQDQMSMAASVESRVPFLDHKLVEFTSSLPERLKLRRWTTKYVLRQSMKNVLPAAILDRPKMGFPVPLGSWFRGAYASVLDEYVLGSRALERGLFKAEFVRSLVEQHRRGEANHSERLWSLVNLEMWHRRFIDGEQANTESVDESLLATART